MEKLVCRLSILNNVVYIMLSDLLDSKSNFIHSTKQTNFNIYIFISVLTEKKLFLQELFIQ